MSKPRWSWQWMALKFWNLGGRKHGKRRLRRTRAMRMESLTPRIVLAADAFLGDEQVALDPVSAEEASVQEAKTETLEVDVQGPSPEVASEEAGGNYPAL